MGLPRLLWNFQAARIAQISIVYSRLEKPDWIQIERQATPTYTLDYLFWVLPKERPPILSPILSQFLTQWDKLRLNSSLISDCRPLAHIFNNLDFTPGQDIKAFKWYLDKGLY